MSGGLARMISAAAKPEVRARISTIDCHFLVNPSGMCSSVAICDVLMRPLSCGMRPVW